MAKLLAELPSKLGSSVVDTDLALSSNSDSTTNNKMVWSELAKSFTGFIARATAGFSLFGKSSLSGIFVSDGGLVGIDNVNPTVALDIGDISTNGVGAVRINARAANRDISYNLSSAADSVYYRFSKKASDPKSYIEYSTDGSSYSQLMSFDTSGNVSVAGYTGSALSKFYVSGGNIRVENSGSGLIIDSYNCELYPSVNGDTLYLGKTSLNSSISLGNNIFVAINDITNPRVGVNTSSPSYPLHVNSSGTVFGMTNTGTSMTRLLFSNNSNTGYFFLNSNSFSFGSYSLGKSVNNINYDLSTAYLGVGKVIPTAKLHAYSASDQIISKVEGDSTSIVEYNLANNNASGPTKTSMITYSRYDSANDVKKWGLGNIYASGPLKDVLAVVANGDPTSNANIKGFWSGADYYAAGSLYNFTITGGTVQTSYNKGKFTQIHKTTYSPITGSSGPITNQIYIDPLGVSKASNSANNHTQDDSPFAIAPFGGRIEQVYVMSSAASVSLGNCYLEFYAAQPSGSTGNKTNIPAIVSGSPRQPYVYFGLNQNANTALLFANFGGTGPTFNAGDLIQYRLYGDTFQSMNIPMSISSIVSYTVT